MHSIRVAHEPTRAVRRTDIVITGCGRVYVFPPTLVQVQRLAGLDHPQHRVGYVEAADEGWIPLGLHNRPVAPASRSRTEALYQVVIAAGFIVARSSLKPRLRCIGTTRTFGDTRRRDVGVFIDQLGTLFLSDRLPSERGAPRLTLKLGVVWLTGDRVAALTDSAESRERTLHRSYHSAIAGFFINRPPKRPDASARKARALPLSGAEHLQR